MGLDMFINGRKMPIDFKNKRMEDGFEVNEVDIRLCCWRKHPNLHGYIVNTFAEGVDECQEISLDAEKIDQIIKAVNEHDLPTTGGFFFGTSYQGQEQDERDIEQLEKAKEWLAGSSDKEWRRIYYRASW